MREMSLRIAVFVSGQGTNLIYIHQSCLSQKILGEVVLVVSDRVCRGVEWAAANKIPVAIIPMQENREEWDSLIVKTLDQYSVHLVCLAGFMKILGKKVVETYSGRILNIHPGILPELAGKDPQKKALDLRLPFTGNTVHLVTEKTDDSSVVFAEDRVEIYPDDTEESLSERLKQKGYETYLRGINKWNLYYKED